MAISPGQYNISLQRRADYSVTLQFKLEARVTALEALDILLLEG